MIRDICLLAIVIILANCAYNLANIGNILKGIFRITLEVKHTHTDDKGRHWWNLRFQQFRQLLRELIDTIKEHKRQ